MCHIAKAHAALVCSKSTRAERGSALPPAAALCEQLLVRQPTSKQPPSDFEHDAMANRSACVTCSVHDRRS